MKQRGFEIARGWEDKSIQIPRRETSGAAGYDIAAAEDTVVPAFRPGQKPTIIPTGLKAYCQPDECFLILNRSSGPIRGIVLANGVGLVDNDYYNNSDNDGHFKVIVFNVLDHDLTIKKGDRIAQVVFQKFLTTDDDNATGERHSGIGSTNRPKIVYDCDDVLWPLTERVCKKCHIPLGKQTVFRIQDDPKLTDDEKQAMAACFDEPENFCEMQFYPEISELADIFALGAEVAINSNCFNKAIAELKRNQLSATLPFLRKKDLHVNVVTPQSNHKSIGDDVLVFVDDSPYNIARSKSLINLVPMRPWNTTNDAKQTMLSEGSEIVKDWQQALPAIVSVNVGKHIIYVEDLAEANAIIKQTIKLTKRRYS